MLQKIRKIIKNDKGFTLIELMVVVVILGILAAIAIPRFVDKSTDAKKARVKADIKIVQTAIDLYMIETGTAAADIDATTALVPKYLKAAPAAPSGYSYTVTDGVMTSSPAVTD